jgi:hypothetical protein
MTGTNNAINGAYSEKATDHPYFRELVHSLKIQGISTLSTIGSLGIAYLAVWNENYGSALIALGGAVAGTALGRRDSRRHEARGEDLDRLITEDSLGDDSE